MLISTLPSANKLKQIEEMFSNPSIVGARYNVGIRSSYGPHMTLMMVSKVAKATNKDLWVDLKGRQLRIQTWADPTYGDIELNHAIEVDLPAKVYFRGDQSSTLVQYSGNKIVVDPDPPNALGAGQAINIIGNNLKIKGDYLTNTDKEYLEAAQKLGVKNFMLSFVEQESDLQEVRNYIPDANLILKIESIGGLRYVANDYHKTSKCNLMAARDDLMINIGDNKANMIPALELIVAKDPDAVLASHLFRSLEHSGGLAMGDISDIVLMKDMGYKNFMLSDGVAHHHFEEAVKYWNDINKWYKDHN
ncbi:hypothetical protein HOK51_02025 [Candidatus Woesearchaeota archaeon]|jgi:pyruvate kinase|nr:hypothetical protein [Candidatus Woesearchaeota archaeon]MBT6518593.1 hypothetical protein [Candidatus Woesearchaeota archaeon]MBT7367458.1 hypothetical protein [Candidatus Woesearchaeota archaeon]